MSLPSIYEIKCNLSTYNKKMEHKIHDRTKRPSKKILTIIIHKNYDRKYSDNYSY